MGICLGLLAALSLLHKHGCLVQRITSAGPHHASELDAYKQVPEVVGPLYTVSRRLPSIAHINYFRLLAWPDKG